MKAGAVDPSAIVRVYVTDSAHAERSAADSPTRLRNTLADPDFVAEMKKSNLDINPLSGEEVRKIVDNLFKLNAGDAGQTSPPVLAPRVKISHAKVLSKSMEMPQ